MLGVSCLLLISFTGNHSGVLADELVKQPTVLLSTKVLSPEKFVGKVALGYKAAQTIPEVCSKLFCYCGCDLTDSHTSLLDCFTCMHGMDCNICLDEAIVALHLKEQGKSLTEIQNTIDDGFALQYPWDKPSPALIKYRETYKIPGNQSTKSGIISAEANKKSHPGKCCGHQ
jgi:Protein of unknown function with PCYCGC motif